MLRIGRRLLPLTLVVVSLGAGVNSRSGEQVALGDRLPPPKIAPISTVPAQGASGDRRVAADAGNRNEPSVAVDPTAPDRILVAMHHFTQHIQPLYAGVSPQVEVHLSEDGGESFDHVYTAYRPSEQVYTFDPSTAFDFKGRAFVGYGISSRNENGLFVARSRDGSKWPPSVMVAKTYADAQGCHRHDKPYLAVDTFGAGSRDRVAPKGSVYLTWQEIIYGPNCAGFLGERIMLVRSTDSGQTFSDPRQVSPEEFAFGAVGSVAPDGTLHIAYVRDGQGDCEMSGVSPYSLDVVVATSRDGGRNFSYMTVIEDFCGITAPTKRGGLYYGNSLPTIETLSDGSVVVVAAGALVDRDGLLVVRSGDGKRWSQPQVVGGPTEILQLPWLDATADGKRLALVALRQLAGGVFEPVVFSSSDGARTWSNAISFVSQPSIAEVGQSLHNGWGIGHYIGLAIGSDRIAHPVWTDVRRPFPLGNQDVWTARVPIS